MKLKKVYPKSRISTKDGLPESGIRLLSNKYYRCPHCNKRTLIKSSKVSPFATDSSGKGNASVFDFETKKAFDALGRVMKFSIGSDRVLDAYDFFCNGCKRPVRLLYEESERAMGSEITAVVFQIVELDD